MSNLPVTTPDFFRFINDNRNSDITSVMLKYHKKNLSFDLDFALVQIKCRRKASRKLGIFLKNEMFLVPSVVSAEQASHQAVALFHASLIPENSTVLDMTAGLGIDVMTVAKMNRKALAIEIEPLKAECLKYNSEILNISNLEVITADSVKWLEKTECRFNVIFIDPARRDTDNKRTYNFHDCQPDIIALQNLLRSKCDRVFIKASPLLDITQTLRDISDVCSIRAVCVDGECKEILVETACSGKDGYSSEYIMKEAIDLNVNGDVVSRFSYTTTPESDASSLSIKYADHDDLQPGHYLYEPNAAMMKLAPWLELTRRYDGLKKLAPSSHLFVSPVLHEDFPGRILSIDRLLGKKDRKTLKGLPVNIVVRNYPVSAEDLRKQLSVKEGMDLFIYGTRLDSPVLVLARRLQNLKPAESTI